MNLRNRKPTTNTHSDETLKSNKRIIELELLNQNLQQLLDISRNREKSLLNDIKLIGGKPSTDVESGQIFNDSMKDEQSNDKMVDISVNKSNDESFDNEAFLTCLLDRCVWLVGLLLCQSCSSFIIKSNEQLMKDHVIIIQYLTMLVGSGGNAGNQSAVRVIRYLALGSLNKSKYFAFMSIESLYAISLSTIIACFGWLRAIIIGYSSYSEAFAIAISLWLIVFISILLGALLPILLQTIRLDPAHASTSIQVVMDILGVWLSCYIVGLILDSKL